MRQRKEPKGSGKYIADNYLSAGLLLAVIVEMTRKKLQGAIRIKRAYEPPERGDGARVLVDRLWPRGLKKDAASLTLWLKDIAPSASLRQWFGHDPARWREFGRRYRAELSHNAALGQLGALLARGPVTLLYAAHDEKHNNAIVLADYLGTHPVSRHGRAIETRRESEQGFP